VRNLVARPIEGEDLDVVVVVVDVVAVVKEETTVVDVVVVVEVVVVVAVDPKRKTKSVDGSPSPNWVAL